MKNYIINNKTVALLKKNKKTFIYDVDNIRVINKKINKLLDDNCNFYGSNLLGRKKSAQILLNICYKVPIIIENNIILIQINNIRAEECLFIVLNKIVDYNFLDGFLRIFCVNNITFDTKISQNRFEKMLINAIKLNNILKWQKTTNIV